MANARALAGALPPPPDSAAAPRATELGREARFDARVRFEPTEAANVVARVPGTDPALRDSAVLLVAHYDHVGIGRPVDGDSIYNGFMDNAVGVATLLAVARALRDAPPPQPVILLLATAEEEGSLGSWHFVGRPLVPLERISAVLDIDLPAPLAPPTDWYLETASDALLARLRTAVSPRGWTVEQAPLLPYSDHWPFAQRGVAAGLLIPGDGWEGVTSEEKERLIARWWKPHTPADEWSAAFPPGGLARVAELAIRFVHARPVTATKGR
jgi:Zn-dependent M28 family amino/carboxypeptidase